LFEKDILEVVDLRGVKQIGFGNAQAIADKAIERFRNGEFDVATLFYARFRSVIQQIPTAQRVIPADTSAAAEEGAEAGIPGFYEFEPDEGEILNSLLPRNIAVQIYRALLENVASEMGAKMSAMDSATRNAGEMIKKQTIFYNRTRQAMITKELIEIISGAEAL
jgi:F-type H+-transporting ATPase subunit gamma